MALRPITLAVDGIEAHEEELALGLEKLEQADRAVVVAQVRELKGAREGPLAGRLRRMRFARRCLRGDRASHLDEGFRDGLLVGLRRFARARFGELETTLDLPSRPERLQQAAGDVPCARAAGKKIAQRWLSPPK
jgi:hypothetical protein